MWKRSIIISFNEEEIKKLDKIRDSLWLRYRNITLSFLINWYIKNEDRLDKEW